MHDNTKNSKYEEAVDNVIFGKNTLQCNSSSDCFFKLKMNKLKCKTCGKTFNITWER